MRKLPEAELELMLEIWKAKEPVCRFDLEKRLTQKKWASTTILTMLSRLEEKAYLKSLKKGKIKYYEPLISEEAYASSVSQNMLERFFGNSLKNFVACMASQESFSEEELEELRIFLDEQKQKGKEEQQEGE